jgi:2-isopropylmalate synthase
VQQQTDQHGQEMTHHALWQLFCQHYG